jgi:1,4-alpha-glucan branching enzyme
MTRGYLALVLHAHLPFVRHPEHESFLEETWLFEAITETYLPLLSAFERLLADGVPFRITVSVSPTLAAMLGDTLLQRRYLEHLDRLEALTELEVARTRGDPEIHPLAGLYRDLVRAARAAYRDRYGQDLLGAFGRLQAAGALELITCAATHAYLPLLRVVPGAVRAQVLTAAASHRRTFGSPASGMWLPECGYYRGLEEVLAEGSFGYFFLESHGALNASSPPRHGVYAPIACPNGVAAFPRDPHTSRLVWSAEEGYPGDPWYRDFHRDIGFDLPQEALVPYIAADGPRVPTGIKYYRVSDRAEPKEPYQPRQARLRAREHAEDFVRRCQVLAAERADGMDRPPLITAPYDAELFGHWWLEGPLWLEHVLRLTGGSPGTLELVTASDYLAREPPPEVATPSASSWGEQGYSEFWLNEGNDWIYPHLHRASRRMTALAAAHGAVPAGCAAGRTLRQAGRSLLLAQASDWAFVMRTGTAVEYAYRRTRDHLARFEHLARALKEQPVDTTDLAALEEMDRIFPELNPAVFLPRGEPGAPRGGAGAAHEPPGLPGSATPPVCR